MKRKTKSQNFFFPYHLISKKELGASQTQVSKITSKMLEHQIEVFDEKHQPKQNETMQSGQGLWVGKKREQKFYIHS